MPESSRMQPGSHEKPKDGPVPASGIRLRVVPCVVILLWTLILVVPSPSAAQLVLTVREGESIQKAIDAAGPGDTVRVEPGVYLENIDFRGKAVELRSTDGAAITIIDGGQKGSVVTFGNGEGTDSVLDGFTLMNGYASQGGGIHSANRSTGKFL